MLLKSSSTPLLGSLLPDATHELAGTGKHPPSPFHCNRLSFTSLHPTPSLHSSPISPSRFSCRGFRRVQSEGNLNTLRHVADSIDIDEHEDPLFFNSLKPNKCSHRPAHSTLQTIPSFSFYDSRGRTEEDEDTDAEEEAEETWADNAAAETGYFGIANKMKAAILTPEVTAMEEAWSRMSFGEEREFVGEEMYLARGLGGGGGYGGHNHNGGGGGEFNGEGGEKHGMEEYYKKMVVENPGNALVLRNYAEFLYQSKGDLRGAEEYYSRAILIDSEDGEILSQYAKLVWELHNDLQRASSYFQRAVQASPQNSHVQAAYANFLWETEEDNVERIVPKELVPQTYTAAATA